MPDTIGNHGLYCPDFDDYAAVALYMQDLGTRIDEQLFAQLTELEGFLSRPTAILTNPANVNVGAGTSSEAVYTSFLFNNAPLQISTQTIFGAVYMTLGSPAGTVNPVTIPTGAWRFGAIARQQTTGALDGFTTRTLFMTIRDDVAGTTIHGVEDTTHATANGPPDANCIVTHELITSDHGIRIGVTASNANVSSSVDILAGGLFWATYEGPIDIIEVV